MFVKVYMLKTAQNRVSCCLTQNYLSCLTPYVEVFSKQKPKCAKEEENVLEMARKVWWQELVVKEEGCRDNQTTTMIRDGGHEGQTTCPLSYRYTLHSSVLQAGVHDGKIEREKASKGHNQHWLYTAGRGELTLASLCLNYGPDWQSSKSCFSIFCLHSANDNGNFWKKLVILHCCVVVLLVTNVQQTKTCLQGH